MGACVNMRTDVSFLNLMVKNYQVFVVNMTPHQGAGLFGVWWIGITLNWTLFPGPLPFFEWGCLPVKVELG